MPEREVDGPKSGNGTLKPPAKQWFIGVGIGKYVELPRLSNAVKDVKDIINVLTEDYGLSPLHTITLFNEEATQENLIHELDQLAVKVGKEDKLIIYFAGHGFLNKATDIGYWIPYDAKKGRTSLYIGNSTIRDYLKAIKSKHTLLIADSCFSGSLFVRGASRSDTALKELDSIPSRWAICSGRQDEEVSDGPPGGNSPFAKSILDTLRLNKRQAFNVAKLADRVVEQTRSNYNQLPEGNPIYGVGHHGGQYIFHRTSKDGEFWESDDKEVLIEQPINTGDPERRDNNQPQMASTSNAIAVTYVQHLSKIKRSGKLCVFIPALYFSLIYFLLNTDWIVNDYPIVEISPVVLYLGFAIHQLHGVFICFNCKSVGFEFGLYARILIPLLTFLGYWITLKILFIYQSLYLTFDLKYQNGYKIEYFVWSAIPLLIGFATCVVLNRYLDFKFHKWLIETNPELAAKI